MANVSSPTGFRPVRHRSGSRIIQNAYSIASGYTEDIFKGDPVALTGTGTNIALSAADDTNAVGIFAGCEWTPTTGGKRVFSKYWPDDQTGTDIVAYVWDDPWIIFEAQCDDLAELSIGLGCQWVDGGGSTVTGLSAGYLNSIIGGTVAATAVQMRLERLVPRDDNAYGAYAKVECSWMENALLNVVAGVGGV